MKKILLSLLLIPTLNFAQDFKLLKRTNNVEVFYKISKIGETDSNDKYLLEINYSNQGDTDIFYSSPTKGKDENHSYLAELKIPQVTNVFSQYSLNIVGEKTKLAIDGNFIYLLKSKKEMSKNIEFKVKKGVEPTVALESNEKAVVKYNLNDFL